MFKPFILAAVVASILVGSTASASACGGCSAPCGVMAAPTDAPAATAQIPRGSRTYAQAPSGSRTYRRFSYEPSTGSYEPSVRSYAPPMMGGRGSQTPSYMLPKTDPRRFR